MSNWTQEDVHRAISKVVKLIEKDLNDPNYQHGANTIHTYCVSLDLLASAVQKLGPPRT